MKKFHTQHSTVQAKSKKLASQPDQHRYFSSQPKNIEWESGQKNNEGLRYTHNPNPNPNSSFLKERMKSIIAQNENYFMNKINGSDDRRHGHLRLKLPSKVGSTIYRTGYKGKKPVCKNIVVYSEQFPMKKVSENEDFLGDTIYRNDFTFHRRSKKLSKKKQNRSVETEIPNFHTTQYRKTYLNWKGNNEMFSMRPSDFPAVTNLPFQAVSVYRSDFVPKTTSIQEPFRPVHLGQRTISKKKSQNAKNIEVLTHKTINKLQYDEKNSGRLQNLKPKTQILNVDRCQFKGKTEYQNSFMGKPSTQGKKRQVTLGQLQNIILQGFD